MNRKKWLSSKVRVPGLGILQLATVSLGKKEVVNVWSCTSAQPLLEVSSFPMFKTSLSPVVVQRLRIFLIWFKPR